MSPSATNPGADNPASRPPPWADGLLSSFAQAGYIKAEPPILQPAEPFLELSGEETKASASFMGAPRNQRSVTIDIAKPEGQALVRRIADRADVLVENFKQIGRASCRDRV